MIDPDAFDLAERQQPLRCHPELRHLGVIVASMDPWQVAPNRRPEPDETMSGLTVPFLAATTIDDLDLDDLAEAFRSNSSPDGYFGFVLTIVELRGLVDGGAIDLEQYLAAAEMAAFVRDWACETAAEEAAQTQADADATHRGARAAEQSHRVVGGPALKLPAPVHMPSSERQKVLAGS